MERNDITRIAAPHLRLKVFDGAVFVDCFDATIDDCHSFTSKRAHAQALSVIPGMRA
jgi:hypothetical protein